MKVTRGRVCAVLVVLLAGIWLAGSAPVSAGADQGVTVQLKGQPGEEMRYRTEANMAIEVTANDPKSGKAVFTMAPKFSGRFLELQRVEAVLPDGNLTLGGRLESFEASLTVGDLALSAALSGPNGSAARFPRLPEIPLRAVMSPRGALVSITGLENLPIPPIPMGPGGPKLDLKSALPKLIALFSLPAYPDHPVRAGESWKAQFVVDPAAIMEAMGVPVPKEAADQMKALRFPIVITSTLTGFETVEGVQTAVIRSEAPWQLNMPAGPPGEQVMVSESGRTVVVTNFDVAAGRRIRAATTSEFQMSVRKGETQVMSMSMQAQGTTNLVP